MTSRLIFAFLLLPFFTFGNNEVDSLLTILEHAKEKEKPSVYYQLCNNYYTIDLDTVLLTAKDGLKIAKETNQPEYVALFYKVIGNVYNYIGDYDFAENYYDTALQVASKYELSDQIGTLYSNIGTLYEAKGELNKALDYYKNAYHIDSTISNEVGINNAMHNIGSIYLKNGNYPDAIKYMKEALRLSTQQNDEIGIYGALNNLGLAYYRITDYETAANYYIQSLEITEKIGDDYYASFTLINLGSLHMDWNNYTKSLDFFQKAKVASQKSGNTANYIHALYNIGTIMQNSEKYDSSLVYFNKALKNAIEINDNYIQASIFSSMGETYQAIEEYKKAEDYFLKSLKYRQDLSLVDDAATSYYYLANLAFKTGETQRAITWAKKCNEVAIGKQTLIENYLLLSAIYEKLNSPTRALLWHKKYSELKDSIFSEEKHVHIQNLQTQYETERKETEIKTLKNKSEIQQLQFQKTRLISGFAIAILSLILLVGYFIYSRRRLLAEKTIALSEQKHLRLQMNPHFIFNALSAIQHYIIKNDSLTASSYLSKFAKLMRSILYNSKSEFITLSAEIETLTNYLELQKIRLDEKLDYSIQEPDFETDDIKVPGMLAQPFVENCIEHGILKKDDKSGEISISYSVNGKILSTEIEDDGIGREIANAQKKSGHHSMATSIIEERLKILGKEFKNAKVSIVDIYKEDKPAGTKVIINLPLIEA